MDLLEKEWFIEAPWGKLCIVAWGDCTDPPVLLVHGTVDTAATFRPLVKMLPRKFYYIAVEAPGNGRSDPYPPGLMISLYDLVYVITVVVRHFRWDQFIYVGHSLGTIMGMFYDLSYPGKISRVVQLDPVTSLLTVPPEKFAEWYQTYFVKYFEKYDAFNKPKENGRTLPREEALETIKKTRGLTDELAAATLERMSEPKGNGLIRYTFDQRTKLINRPPISPQHLKRLLTSIQTPTLSVFAEDSVSGGRFKGTTFMMDESQYPSRNVRVLRVEGGHDVHFVHPERIAGHVGQFLLHGLEGLDSKPKL